MAVRPRQRRSAVLTVSTLAMGLGAAPTFLTGYLGPALRADLHLSGACLVMAGLAALNAVAAALILPGAVRQTSAHLTTRGRLPRGFVWVALAAVFFVVGTNPLTSWLVLS